MLPSTLAGIFHAQVVRIGVHAHDLLLDLVGRVGEVDAVPERFGHLGLAVRTGQAQTGGVVGQEDFGHGERFAVDGVELVDDLAGLLDHRLLVLTHGDGCGPEGGDVRRLADGVGEESDGDSLTLGGVALDGPLGESAHLDLGLDGGVALQALHRDEVHVVEGQLAQFGNLRLDEKGRFCGVETDGEVVQSHLDDVLAHLFGVVGVVGECLCVGDHDEDPVEFSGVLEFHAAPERADEVSEVQPARGAVAGEYDFSHIQKLYILTANIRKSGRAT